MGTRKKKRICPFSMTQLFSDSSASLEEVCMAAHLDIESFFLSWRASFQTLLGFFRFQKGIGTFSIEMFSGADPLSTGGTSSLRFHRDGTMPSVFALTFAKTTCTE